MNPFSLGLDTKYPLDHLRVGEGLLASSSRDGLSLEPLFHDPHAIREAFLGVIVQQGPKGEEDYTDARYWVREIIENSRDFKDEAVYHRPSWIRLREWLDKRESTKPFGARWTTAYNLTEGSLSPATELEDETHDLSVDGSVLVHIFAAISPSQTLKLYFAAGGKGGSENTAFAVVTKINEPEGVIVIVRQVEPDSNGVSHFTGSEKSVWCWPGTRAKHYAAYQWTAPSLNFNTPVLPVVQNNKKFYVQQYNRYSLQPRPQNIHTTDCQTP